MKKILLWILVGIVTLSVSLSVHSQSLEELHNEGVKLYQAGEYEAAAHAFLEVLTRNPRALTPLEYLGGSLLRLERYEEAIEFLDRALAVNPFDPDTLYDLGVAYDYKGNLEQASHYYQEAVKEYELRPEKLDRVAAKEVYNNLGITQLAQQNYPSALKSFQESVHLDPRFGQGYYLQGLAHTNQAERSPLETQSKREQELAQAEKAFIQSISSDVDFDWPEKSYNGQGVIHYLKKDLPAALRSFTTSIRIAQERGETYPTAYANRGLTHFDLGQLQAAEIDYSQVTQIVPEDPVAFKDKGFVQFEIGEYAKRQAQAEKITQAQLPSIPDGILSPPQWVASRLLEPEFFQLGFLNPKPLPKESTIAQTALLQTAQLKWEAAAKSFEQAILLNPNYAEAHYGLASVLRRQHKYERALSEFQISEKLYRIDQNNLWAAFVKELDIPALQLRLQEPILPQDLPTYQRISDPIPQDKIRLGFAFQEEKTIRLLDSDQLESLAQDIAINNNVSPATRREAIHALRLKHYRPAYPLLQSRLAQQDSGEYREPDRGVRSAILYFLEEVEAPPPPAPKAKVTLLPPKKITSSPSLQPKPETQRSSNPKSSPASPISPKKVNTSFAAPKPANGCQGDSIVSAAICRIRA
jgi:tetratricopeptide (TPR) repeat protein